MTVIEQSRYPYTNIDHPATSYIVIDLEWNQPIPWIKTNVDPKDLPGEIIEIGAVKLCLSEEGYLLSKPFHVMIRPVCYTVMNKNVSRVTNKMSSDLRFGLSFSDAYNAFCQWCGKDYVLCGWGNSDLSILKSNLRFHNHKAELNALFLDVQPLFARVAEGLTQQRSVEYAVDFLRIPKRDDFHCAHRDAEYTGLVLMELFKLLDLAKTDAPDPAAETSQRQEPRYPSTVLPSLENPNQDGHDTEGHTEGLLSEMKALRLMAYLQNPDLYAQTSMRTDFYPTWEKCFEAYPAGKELCPACRTILSCQIDWFRLKKSAFSLWCCEDHHMVLGRMRMKKTPDGKVYASVSVRLTDPGTARLVSERYEEYIEFGSAGRPFAILPEDTAETPETQNTENAFCAEDIRAEKAPAGRPVP